MAISQRSGRSRATLVFLVLLSLTVLTLDFRGQGSALVEGLREGAADAFAPVRSVVDAALAPARTVWDGVVRFDDVARENAELRARLDEVEGARLRAEEALRQRRGLLDLQSLDFAAHVPSVPARVVSAAPSNFELTVEIDRGHRAGVEEDMPVVTGAGLVGRVVQASDERALVQLLTDPDAAVGVRLASSGALGLAQGRGRGEPLLLGFVSDDVPVRPREAVLTSGLSTSVFPPDVPVGRVVAVEGGERQGERTIRVEPAADLGRLEFVRVLQWSPPAQPAPAGAEPAAALPGADRGER